MELQWEVRQVLVLTIVVAELYMQNHDNRALTTFDNSPRIYERFVDDLVSVIKRENLEQFHNHMNTFAPENSVYY